MIQNILQALNCSFLLLSKFAVCNINTMILMRKLPLDDWDCVSFSSVCLCVYVFMYVKC